MTEKNECEKAYTNPSCPYVTVINLHSNNLNCVKKETEQHSQDIAVIKNDVGWLKKGYWLQTAFGLGTLTTVIGIAIYLLTGNKLF